MGTAAVKLALSLASGIICFVEYRAEKSVAAIFCFIMALMLFIGFVFDVVRICRYKDQKKMSVASPAIPILRKAPATKDYPDAPDPSDLKIGKTYRAVDVSNYLSNIQALALENPDYNLSESEIIDNYLTDKKIWKYSFKLKNITLKPLFDSEEQGVGVFAEDRQIGDIRSLAGAHLLKALKKNGAEVVYCTIGGGPYKIVHDDVRTGQYSIQNEETPYSVTLSVCEK